MRIARLALPAMLTSLTVWCAPASAASLIPHRAVYNLALDEASERSGISGISGRMVYEFNGSPCEGYTVTFRFVTRIDTEDVSRLTDQQTTTFEEGHGKSFTFVTRSFVDQSLQKELKGTARLDPAATKVSLEKPEVAEVTLEETQFPTQHLLELLDKAKKGETFYETTLFDGSEDGNKVMTTTVVIGKPSAPVASDSEAKAIPALGKDNYWPVDMAYFDLSTGEEIPTYRISFKLHDNGITRDLTMDYGDFSMTGSLVDLKTFDAQKDCEQ
jgi:hypothetical protein